MAVPVPVVMFHSIRPPVYRWKSGFLSCPTRFFESYLIYLKSHGYQTVLLTDLLNYLEGRGQLPGKSVALTFDDGYLDNWIFAAPLLRKYGFFGTIFVSPEFVDPREVIREQWNLEEGGMPDASRVDGFMSWLELKEAQNSGVFDVQSHTMTHTWVFTSSRIVDFHHPGDSYHWLAWNERPDRKPYWMEEDQSEIVAYGAPVYTYERAITARRFFESEGIRDEFTEFVAKNGGVEFFKRTDWRERLFALADQLCLDGCIESEDEYRARLVWELSSSREEIESRIGKRVDIVCWPGGSYNDTSIEAAQRVGYRGWDIRVPLDAPNVPCRKPPGIFRVSVPVLDVGVASAVVNKLVFKYILESYRGIAPWKQFRWAMRNMNITKLLLRRQFRKAQG